MQFQLRLPGALLALSVAMCGAAIGSGCSDGLPACAAEGTCTCEDGACCSVGRCSEVPCCSDLAVCTPWHTCVRDESLKALEFDPPELRFGMEGRAAKPFTLRNRSQTDSIGPIDLHFNWVPEIHASELSACRGVTLPPGGSCQGWVGTEGVEWFPQDDRLDWLAAYVGDRLEGVLELPYERGVTVDLWIDPPGAATMTATGAAPCEQFSGDHCQAVLHEGTNVFLDVVPTPGYVFQGFQVVNGDLHPAPFGFAASGVHLGVVAQLTADLRIEPKFGSSAISYTVQWGTTQVSPPRQWLMYLPASGPTTIRIDGARTVWWGGACARASGISCTIDVQGPVTVTFDAD